MVVAGKDQREGHFFAVIGHSGVQRVPVALLKQNLLAP